MSLGNTIEYQKQDILLLKTDYFKTYAYTKHEYDSRMGIEIIRRDTLEPYFRLDPKSKDKQEMILQVNDFFEQHKITKPVDWKAPHRYCIATCTRMEISREDLSYASMENNLDPDIWWSYIATRVLKETVLVRKLNALSFEERKQLLIIKDWEVRSAKYYRILLGLYFRDYLYRRLFDKTGLENYYKQYIDWLDEYSKSKNNK